MRDRFSHEEDGRFLFYIVFKKGSANFMRGEIENDENSG
jgi:hypothetical protein